ncbi:MAG: ParB N-terminal domain-containing protein, partial [Opitutales bacterium]|nr:ParB N-terminal domain-containing protein [Opitutales bacterium]
MIKTDEYQIKMIPTDSIRMINPRKREQRKYAEIVRSIKILGLKTPIVVAPRRETGDGKLYDLVCGQGRLETFINAGEPEIPARILNASREDALLMSLAENYARRQADRVSVLREVSRLCGEGYTFAQIGRKLGFSESYICNLKGLIAGGNKNLNRAVLTGKISIQIALKIVECSKDSEVQDLLNDLY